MCQRFSKAIFWDELNKAFQKLWINFPISCNNVSPNRSFVGFASCSYLRPKISKLDSDQTDFHDLSSNMRFPTMWYVQVAKAQISRGICLVWSEHLLIAWIFYDCQATGRTAFRVSKLKMRLHRLVWVCNFLNTTLLEIICHGSFELGFACLILTLWIYTIFKWVYRIFEKLMHTVPLQCQKHDVFL